MYETEEIGLDTMETETEEIRYPGEGSLLTSLPPRGQCRREGMEWKGRNGTGSGLTLRAAYSRMASGQSTEIIEKEEVAKELQSFV